MRAGVLLALVAVASCSDPAPPGLTLEVLPGSSDVTRIELHVGRACHEDCPRGAQPPGMTPKLVDRVYLVDDPVPLAVDLVDDRAVFSLRPASPDHELKLHIVLAIGYDAAGEPVASAQIDDVTVPVGDGLRASVTLVPAQRMAEDYVPHPPGTWRVMSWTKPASTLPRCVLSERWTDHGPSRSLVVPKNDPDCDMQPNECAPWIPDALGSPPTIEQASCFTIETVGDAPTCLVGGPPCSELAPTPAPACTELDVRYCAPSWLCDECDSNELGCIEGLLRQNTDLAHIRCTFPATTTPEGLTPCNEEDRIDNIPPPAGIPPSAVLRCTSIRVAPAGTPFGPFADSADVGIGTFAIDHVVEPCGFAVRFEASSADPSAYEPGTTFFLDATLDNGNHIFIPVSAELVDTQCNPELPASCSVVLSSSNDPLWACLESTPRSCAPSGGCLGPMCGANGEVCCGLGEQCVNGQCVCGGNSGCGPGDICASQTLSNDLCGSVCCGASGPCPTSAPFPP